MGWEEQEPMDALQDRSSMGSQPYMWLADEITRPHVGHWDVLDLQKSGSPYGAAL